MEIFRVTDYNTPLGRVVIGRAAEDGYAEISGPHSSLTIRDMCIEMQELGAELVLIDGSLDRRASAAPYVSDGTVWRRAHCPSISELWKRRFILLICIRSLY